MRRIISALLVVGLFLAVIDAHGQQIASPVDIPCPNDEPCQVLVLTRTEINILTQDNGILATAAQARNLDLGQFVSYFRQKISLAPAGKNAPKDGLTSNAPPVADEKKPEAAKKQP